MRGLGSWRGKTSGGPPQISAKEFRQEKGLTASRMAGLMARADAPKPLGVYCPSTGHQTYYSAKEMAEWWERIKSS